METVIEKLVAMSRELGCMGFMVVDQGGSDKPFVGAFVGRDGAPTRNTWHTHASPEDAWKALLGEG